MARQFSSSGLCIAAPFMLAAMFGIFNIQAARTDLNAPSKTCRDQAPILKAGQRPTHALASEFRTPEELAELEQIRIRRRDYGTPDNNDSRF